MRDGLSILRNRHLGARKQLTPDEIVGQWFAACHSEQQTITNIVFMGMGEPTDNIEAVLQAIRVLTEHGGPAIAPSRISVSTVGRAQGIERLAEFANEPGFRQLRLAVSLNAPNDEVRQSIMPVNRGTTCRSSRRHGRLARGRPAAHLGGIRPDPRRQQRTGSCP